MSKRSASRKQATPAKDRAGGGGPLPGPGTQRSKLWLAAASFIGLVFFGGFILVQKGRFAPAPERVSKERSPLRQPQGTLTFTKDVAPILFNRCAPCHQTGQSAPFPLLSYAEVKKRAHQIAEVTARRYMPPWLPEPGYGEFADMRRLTPVELDTIQQWIADGAAEGDPSLLTAAPPGLEGWQLGQPDLIVELPRFTLASEGKDVYRNLVAPIPVSATRFVRGVEFLPGNPRIVHHAFINVDESRQCRRLAARQEPPGFDGMDLPESAGMPGGQLLGWQPGKVPSMVDPGLAWVLKTNTDLVLQMHLHPSGKPEPVEAKVGLFFTDQPPSTVPFRLRLVRFDFEIPAGAEHYPVEQSYVLPVDVEIRRILPHCHYLGKDLQAYALLPDGQKRWLLWIKDWDFNWQGDYKYAQPVSLPKGTKLVMHYSYDNSTHNVRNPNSPPKTVVHGLQTTDEMAALALQAVVRSPQDRARLAEDYYQYFVRVSMDYYAFRIRRNPADAEAHMKLGRALSAQGQDREALDHLLTAVKLNPGDDRAHYELGYFYLRRQQSAPAFDEFQEVVRLNPNDYEAFGSLGYLCLAAGRQTEARRYLENALRLNPEDTVARQNLALLMQSAPGGKP